MICSWPLDCSRNGKCRFENKQPYKAIPPHPLHLWHVQLDVRACEMFSNILKNLLHTQKGFCSVLYASYTNTDPDVLNPMDTRDGSV